MKHKKLILTIIVSILAVLGIFAGTYISKEAQNSIGTVQNIVQEELDRIDNVETIQNSTEETEENQSTTVIEDLTVEEEQALEEQEIESESFELQGEIAYEGDKAKSWNIELRRLCRTYILQSSRQ